MCDEIVAVEVNLSRSALTRCRKVEYIAGHGSTWLPWVELMSVDSSLLHSSLVDLAPEGRLNPSMGVPYGRPTWENPYGGLPTSILVDPNPTPHLI